MRKAADQGLPDGSLGLVRFKPGKGVPRLRITNRGMTQLEEVWVVGIDHPGDTHEMEKLGGLVRLGMFCSSFVWKPFKDTER